MTRTWAALMFAMVFPTVMAWVYFIALAEKPRSFNDHHTVNSPPRNPVVIGAYSAGKILQFIFPLLWLRWGEQRRWSWTRPRVEGIGLGIGFGIITGSGIFGTYQFLRHNSRFVDLHTTAAKIQGKLVEFGLDNPAGFILFAAFLCVLHSFLEEYYWRWFVFGRLEQLILPGPAMLLSSLAFMAHHVITLAVFFPGKFWQVAAPMSLCVGFGGCAWAWLYHRTQSLLGPWISHLLIDGAIMSVGFVLVFN